MAYFEGSEKNVFEDCIFEITREKNGNNKTEYYKSKTFGENDIQIVIDSRGKIINIGKDKQPKTTSLSIGIRPESAEHSYPGDDYILGLKVTDGKALYEIDCNEKDYIAVYDKKMLWRANLYIDEGSEDWNNVHPWNVPAEGTDGGPAWWDGDGSQTAVQRWGNNEWNKKADGTSGDGKQISIEGWYRFTGGTAKEYRSVTYSFGTKDIFSKFNEEVRAQDNKIDELLSLWEEQENQQQNQTSQNTTVIQANNLPGSKWKSYVFYENVANSSWIPSGSPYKTTDDVSVPGWSSYLCDYVDGSKGKLEYNFDMTKKSSGIDCSGLAYISAVGKPQDANSIYKCGSVPSVDFGTSAFASDENTLQIYTEEWKLETPDNSTDTVAKSKRDIQRKVLAHAVPGDILVKPGHVVIIQNINTETNSNGVLVVNSSSDIEVIHSTTGTTVLSNQFKVLKCNWDNVESSYELYQLRRLLNK